MGQRRNDAPVVKDVQIISSKEECAEDMGPRCQRRNAAVMDAQTMW